MKIEKDTPERFKLVQISNKHLKYAIYSRYGNDYVCLAKFLLAEDGATFLEMLNKTYKQWQDSKDAPVVTAADEEKAEHLN